MKQIFAVLLCCALFAGCGTAVAQSAALSAPASEESSPAPSQQTAPAVSSFTNTVERPVAVAISNRPGAVAQWGLAQADIVMEARIDHYDEYTDYCLLFPTLESVPKVGPIAPAKDLFLQFAVPQNALLAQRGMNRYGENLLNRYGLQPLDALYVGVNSYDYDRSLPYDVPDEFHWYTSGTALRNALALYGLSSQGGQPGLLPFGTPAGGSNGVRRVDLHYSSWYQCAFTFAAESDLWLLQNADGSFKLDANDQQPVAFRNLLLLACEMPLKDDGHTFDYDLRGGTGFYLYGEHWLPIRWEKEDAHAELKLFDADGNAVWVEDGHTYIGFYNAADPSIVTLSDTAGAVLNR